MNKTHRQRSVWMGVVWVGSWIACGGFCLLLVGLGVHELIIIQQEPAAPQVVEPAATETSVVAELPLEDPSTPPAEREIEVPAPAPELPVAPLPATASEQRTLPTTLIVGAQPGMYSSLQDAFRDAISGDAIEVHTDVLSLTEAVHLESAADGPATSIVLRPGKGYSPVLRWRGNALWGFVINNGSLRIEDLHLTVDSKLFNFCRVDSGRIGLQSCSFTRLPSTPGMPVHAIQIGRSADLVEFDAQDCLLRNVSGVQAWNPVEGARGRGRFSNCAIAGNHGCVYRNLQGPAHELRVEFEDCSIICDAIAVVTPRELHSLPAFIKMQRNYVVAHCLFRYGEPQRGYWWSHGSKQHQWIGEHNFYVANQLATVSKEYPLASKENTVTLEIDNDLQSFAQLFGSGSEVESRFQPVPSSQPGLWQPYWNCHPSAFALNASAKAALAVFHRRGVSVGCDVRRLPTPPPSAAQY